MSSGVAMDISDPESSESTTDDVSLNRKVFTEAEKRDLVDKDRYYHRLAEYYKAKANKKPLTRERLNSLLEEVQIAKGKRFRKNRREYFVLRTYDTAEVNGKHRVIRKNDNLPVIAFEDLYDIIFDYHMKTNHGGKTKLEKAYKSGKVNIPRPATEIFVLCCNICHAKRNAPTKTPKTKQPKYVKGFSHKGQVDVVDFQSIPDDMYSMVLSYQDHYTKFMVLRPLENDLPEAIAKELLNIFMMFGAPKILESYNGKYFVRKVLNHISEMWTEPIIGHGEPKYSEIPSKSPEEIENLIRKWMETNFTTNWVTGLNIVQWQENIAVNLNLGRCPYQALFGFTPRLELRSNESATMSTLEQNESSSERVTDSFRNENNDHAYTDEDIESDLFDNKLQQEKSSQTSHMKEGSLECRNCHSNVTGDCFICEICSSCLHSSCQRELLWDHNLERNRHICNMCLSCNSEIQAFKRLKKENEESLDE